MIRSSNISHALEVLLQSVLLVGAQILTFPKRCMNRSKANDKCQIVGRFVNSSNTKKKKKYSVSNRQPIDFQVENKEEIMVVISTELYEDICNFCANFKGLNIHCEQELIKAFSDIDPHVLSAILSKEWQKNIKHRHHLIVRDGPKLLKE